MADPKKPEPDKRPAWARHLDDSVWKSYYCVADSAEKTALAKTEDQVMDTNDDGRADSQQTAFTGSTIQEGDNSASINQLTEIGSKAAQPDQSNSPEFGLPSKEEIEAVIVKSTPATTPELSQPASGKHSDKTEGHSEDHAGKPAENAETDAPESGHPAPADKTEPESGTSDRASAKRGRVAPDPERPIRGYGVLSSLPMLTLTVLLLIHAASFIYSYSNEVIMQDSRQITLAQNLAANSDNLFVPALDGQIIQEITPVQYLFLGGIFKALPFAAPLNMHIAGVLAALLFLWGICLLSKAAIPNNKGTVFGAGLAAMSCVLFLGGVWIFRTEILAVALLSFAQAMLFCGLQKQERAFAWFMPGMFLGGISILCGGPIMALGLFIPLAVYLLFTGSLKRFISKDLLAGLLTLLATLGLWFAGAIYAVGFDHVLDYLAAFNPSSAGSGMHLSAYEILTLACVLLLPWALLPLLLFDRVLAGITGIFPALKTSRGQGILYLIAIMISALLIIGADSTDSLIHPALWLVMLPALVILSAKAVLYMSRARARIFITVTALIFAAITAFSALKAGGFGWQVLPWEVPLWASIPLVGAAAFCTLFLARAAQVSAGRTQLLVYAICWLLFAQVFLFAGMPTAIKHLRFTEIQSVMTEKAAQANWAIAYLDTPAWAIDYSLPNLHKADTWSEMAKLAEQGPVLAVMPESDWKILDKKNCPFKKIESQVLLLTSYVLLQSGDALPPFAQTDNQTDDRLPLSNTVIPFTDNATHEEGTDTSAGTGRTEERADEPDTDNASQLNNLPEEAMSAEPSGNATRLEQATGTLTEDSDSQKDTALVPEGNAEGSPSEDIPLANTTTEPQTEQTAEPAHTSSEDMAAETPEAQEVPQPLDDTASDPAAEEKTSAFPLPTGNSTDPANTPEITGSTVMEDSNSENPPSAGVQPGEKTVITSYRPEVNPQINLLYGVIPGMPQLNIILRYQQTGPVLEE